MPQPIKDRLVDRRAYGTTCEVTGCLYPAHKLGRYCREHAKVNERTGHPLGTTIRYAEIKHLVKASRRYIRQNMDHPQIAEALAWLYDLINDPWRRRIDHVPRNATPKQRLGRWLDRFEDQRVHEIHALALVAGMYLHREMYPRDYRSDRHFQHQLAVRFLRMIRAPRVERWKDGKPYPRYDRIGVQLREYLCSLLQPRLGLLCEQMARLLSHHLLQKGT